MNSGRTKPNVWRLIVAPLTFSAFFTAARASLWSPGQEITDAVHSSPVSDPPHRATGDDPGFR
jgi:hypothetical protein